MALEDALKRALDRERQARKNAEAILEEKALELFNVNNELRRLNNNLEKRIEERTQEIQKSKEELLLAKEAAEKATMAKSVFLSSMSHEIRTPLNGIIGLTQLMLDVKTEPSLGEMLGSVKYSADNLLDILNDILDFSKIEAGKVSFEEIEFSLKELSNALLSAFKHRFEEKGVLFQVSTGANLPEHVLGDKVKLNQILTNLIGNALKFTEKGEVHVLIKKDPSSENGFQFRVRDTGIGIPEDRLKDIFNSFTQSEAGTTRKYGGTGLGLAITEKLVLLQKGTIEVQSVINKGTEFIVNLPFNIPKINKERKEIMNDNVELPENKTVLLVEDNKINQFVASNILQNLNLGFDIANNGLEALNLLEVKRYDAILMDLQMPVMGGIEATNKIRDKQSSVLDHEVPIIALTADAFVETKKQTEDAGMNEYLTKPFVINDFKLALYKVLVKR